MEATIEERKISLTPEYDISVPGRTLHARQVVFALLDKIEVQTEDGSLVATIPERAFPLSQQVRV